MSGQIYDTQACKFYNKNAVISEYNRARILDPSSFSGRIEPKPVDEDWEYLFKFINYSHDDIPQFNHPIILGDKIDESRSNNVINAHQILVDARPHITKTDGGTYTLKSRTDFGSLITRSKLTYNWIMGERVDFLNCGGTHIKLFVNWLGSTIGRVRTLEPETQHTINKIIALYYVNLFKLPDTDNEALGLVCSKKASVSMGMAFEELLDLANQIQFNEFRTLDGLCKYLRELSGTTLLSVITVPVLFNYVANSWIGSTGKELSAIAVEHPPTFLSLLEASINDRTMGRTQMGKLVHSLTRPAEQADFLKSINLLKQTL